MAAARSSKNQWRAFLFTLVEEGDIDVLSPRDAMTQLTKQFGADVHGGDRVWIKQTLVELATQKRDRAQSRPRKKRAGTVMLSSDSDDSDDEELVLVDQLAYIEKCRQDQARAAADK